MMNCRMMMMNCRMMTYHCTSIANYRRKHENA